MRGSDRVTLVTAVDLNFLRTTVLAEEATREWSLDRVHVPVGLVYDHSLKDTVLRASGVLGVYDEGRAFTWGSLAASWFRRWGGLHVGCGAVHGAPLGAHLPRHVRATDRVRLPQGRLVVAVLNWRITLLRGAQLVVRTGRASSHLQPQNVNN